MDCPIPGSGECDERVNERTSEGFGFNERSRVATQLFSRHAFGECGGTNEQEAENGTFSGRIWSNEIIFCTVSRKGQIG